MARHLAEDKHGQEHVITVASIAIATIIFLTVIEDSPHAFVHDLPVPSHRWCMDRAV